MDCQLLVSENIFLKYVSNCLEIELEKIIKIGIDNTVQSERSEESPHLIIFLFCRTDIPVCFFSFFNSSLGLIQARTHEREILREQNTLLRKTRGGASFPKSFIGNPYFFYFWILDSRNRLD